eukprot:Em0013g318a
MLSKLTAFLQQAAEITSQIVLGPGVSRTDEFQDHWKSITDIITSNHKDAKEPGYRVEDSLKRMLELLQAEEREKSDGMGPCLEFVLQHKLLDTLQTVGQNNYPEGMRLHVMTFFTQLLEGIEQPLLPHISIHQAMQKEVLSCGLNPSSPITAAEMVFLRALCLKMQSKTCLADFFIIENDSGKHFLVADALLRIVISQDNSVAEKAYECLLTCASLQYNEVAKAMASRFPLLVASKLQYHAQLIPTSCPPSVVFTCQAGWGAERLRGDIHTSDSCGLGHVGAFFSWLDYCERVVNSGLTVLAVAVCSSVLEQVLVSVLRTKLFKPHEGDIILATAVLTRCIQSIKSELLLKVFVTFVLCEAGPPMLCEAGPPMHPTPHTVLTKLVSLCDHPNDEVCLTTLQLTGGASIRPPPPLDTQGVRKELEQTIESYLTLVPPGLASCGSVHGETDIEQYLIEAHRQVALCKSLGVLWMCDSSSTISAAPLSHDQSCDKGAEEGVFLSALLNKLERLLDQPYDVNLVLTSLLATVASISHPAIDSWLLATDQSQQHERNMFSVLKRVSCDLQTYAERNPVLPVNLQEARRRLVGMETSDLLSVPHNALVEGTIVLEEFVKELCAIIFAKRTSEMFTATYAASAEAT